MVIHDRKAINMKQHRVKFRSIFLLMLIQQSACSPAEDMADKHQAMLEDIRNTTRFVSDETGIGSLDDRVMSAIASVPRHRFVPDDMQSYAYINRPLPIGHKQTISQPFIVALMTHLADVQSDERVLEVGTGSGYQAAILAELAAEVYTIEIIEALGQRAEKTLKEQGYRNVQVRVGDGYAGWPEQAPFDAIIVTAAPENIPPPLVEQLAPGGRLVIPVGSQSGAQTLTVITKDRSGNLSRKEILLVSFVPLTGDH